MTNLSKLVAEMLAAMARDIFSAVATSTPSERAFSAGKETITDRRNRIGHDVVEALQISKSAFKEKRKLVFLINSYKICLK